MKRFPKLDLRDFTRLRNAPFRTLINTLSGRSGAGAMPSMPASLRSLDGLPSLSDFPLPGRPARRPHAPAAPTVPPGARFEEHRHSGPFGARSYKVYIPSTYDGTPLPLVVMLHGCTQSPDDFAAGTGMNAVAEEERLLVAYPEQPQGANPSKCWNWFNAADQKRDSGEPALIAGITREIIRHFAVTPGQVYIAGLSAGGATAAIMAQAYPDLYAAAGVHSGLACGAARDLPSALSAMRNGADGAGPAGTSGTPLIVFHGDGDKTVHPRNADAVAAQTASAGLSRQSSEGVSPGGVRYTRHVRLDASGRPMLEQWLLHGAGHAWSGGSDRGSYTDPRGPDASREMVRFFRHHGAGSDRL